jgi:hypothetical protein
VAARHVETGCAAIRIPSPPRNGACWPSSPEGRTNKEIAALALILSEKTVKNYLSNVLDKLQVSRRSQAAVLFSREPGRFPLTPAFRITPAALRAS